jgi:hypothetical protein
VADVTIHYHVAVKDLNTDEHKKSFTATDEDIGHEINNAVLELGWNIWFKIRPVSKSYN